MKYVILTVAVIGMTCLLPGCASREKIPAGKMAAQQMLSPSPENRKNPNDWRNVDRPQSKKSYFNGRVTIDYNTFRMDDEFDED